MRVSHRIVVLPPRGRLARALELFRAIGQGDRLTVVLALARGKRLCVGSLADLCRTSPSAMSHQLRTLRDAGLIRSERSGKQVYYRLHDPHVARIVEDALEHVAELEHQSKREHHRCPRTIEPSATATAPTRAGSSRRSRAGG